MEGAADRMKSPEVLLTMPIRHMRQCKARGSRMEYHAPCAERKWRVTTQKHVEMRRKNEIPVATNTKYVSMTLLLASRLNLDDSHY